MLEEFAREMKQILHQDWIEEEESLDVLKKLASRCQELLDRVEYRIIELEPESYD